MNPQLILAVSLWKTERGAMLADIELAIDTFIEERQQSTGCVAITLTLTLSNPTEDPKAN